MENRKYIEQALENGYEFRIGEYLSRGFEIFKNNPGGYLGYTVLYLLISFVVALIPFLGTIIGVFISPPLTVGIPIAAHLQVRNGSTEFGNFFKGFDDFAQLLVANIITLLIYILLLIPVVFILGFSFFSALATSDPEAISDVFSSLQGLGLGFTVIILLFTYVVVSLRWTNYLIVFFKYDAVSAIKTSWQLTNKKWFYHLAFVIIFGFAAFLGVIALFVGIILVIPVILAADYVGFVDVTGLNNAEIEDGLSEEAIV
jgi:membrane-anchored glycerophosphoryl diester phosphodiesterase (GDPDase)